MGTPRERASGSLLARLRRFLTSTPRRTFFLYPLLVVAVETLRGADIGIPQLAFLPLLAWGYLQYRLTGAYRRRHEAGSRGFGELPDRLLQGGVYAFTRNPMYLGLLIFLVGLALSFWSALGAAILLANAVWFHRRVLKDEALLRGKFGGEYEAYCRRVKRWIPFLF